MLGRAYRASETVLSAVRSEIDFRLVESSDGRLMKCSGSECECGWRFGMPECTHVRMLQAYTVKDENLFFVAKSALYKEVRLGNQARAVAMTRLMDWIKPGEARKSLRKLLFEETQNIGLLLKMQSKSVSTDELVIDACLSVKDWELRDSWTTCSPRWLKRMMAIKNWSWKDGGLTYNLPTIDELPSELNRRLSNGDIEGVFELVWTHACWEAMSPSDRIMQSVLHKHALDRNLTLGLEIGCLKPISAYQNDELITLACLATGVFDRQAMIVRTAGRIDLKTEVIADVPYMYPYAFDWHTRSGRAKLQDIGGIKFNEPQPQGIDLRYSGGLPFTWWRFLAHERFGRIDVKWEQVRVDDSFNAMWRRACDIIA